MTSTGSPITAIALVGPTASGKTALSEHIAHHLPVEIISADSRQVYRYLTIGTAKPPAELLERIPHHFIDIVDPDESYSAGRFGTEAAQVVQDIHTRGRIPLIVGGSGLYIRALCEGLFDEESADVLPHRVRIEQRLAEEGVESLYSELQRIDPVSAERYSDRNRRRILRALEYYYATGRPLAEAHGLHTQQRNFRTLYFAQAMERPELYDRINRRTVQMFDDGIVEETEAVLALGYSPELNSLNTVGYKECIALLRGELTREEAIQRTQQNTRRYAKRQMTWFRRNETIRRLGDSSENIAKEIVKEYILQSGSAAGPPSPFAA